MHRGAVVVFDDDAFAFHGRVERRTDVKGKEANLNIRFRILLLTHSTFWIEVVIGVFKRQKVTVTFFRFSFHRP